MSLIWKSILRNKYPKCLNLPQLNKKLIFMSSAMVCKLSFYYSFKLKYIFTLDCIKNYSGRNKIEACLINSQLEIINHEIETIRWYIIMVILLSWILNIKYYAGDCLTVSVIFHMTDMLEKDKSWLHLVRFFLEAYFPSYSVILEMSKIMILWKQILK